MDVMSETFSSIWHRRLKYMLTPQWDLYVSLRERLMDARVLEVGVGTGAGTVIYSSATEHVDGIDIDEGAIHFAQSMYPLPNVTWIQADITKYVPGSGYDFVVAIEAIEHIPDWRAALGMCELVLKPGGYFIMSARNAASDLRRWKELHEREWTASELLDSLGEFFPSAYLYDYTLQEQQPEDTRLTPLIAIAKK